MIAEELCDREELAEATYGHLEYSTETADIRVVHPSRVSHLQETCLQWGEELTGPVE